jgi:hypothetical protein
MEGENQSRQSLRLGSAAVDWLEKVSDEQYAKV